MHLLALVILLQSTILVVVNSKECYVCTNVPNIQVCTNTVRCADGQSCFENVTISGQQRLYNLGCVENRNCMLHNPDQSVIIGRNLDKRQTQNCLECCSTDLCNINLCNHTKPSDCIDDVTIDCARLGNLINVCMDVHKAKLICPNFCGLCDLVDGNWGPWGQWSNCEVTCEIGTQTRSRSCSNPPPAHGGLDCEGKSLDSKPCQKPLCPVHGGWSGWSSWGTCSVSCGVGLQERSRNCSNPAPLRFGDHCFGQNWDSKICISDSCLAEGRWNQWSEWGHCSSSCGIGLQRRFRNCSFPALSNFVGHCLGDNSETQLCVLQSCSDGGWSDWTLWSRCNVLENDVGIRSRYRECNNPPPSPFGKTCSGIPVETSKCYALYDCSSVLKENPQAASGIYNITLWKSNQTITVFCDMDTDSGGWTVFQRRTNKILLFNRTFVQYENGFGDFSGEFWLGLKFVKEMTSRKQSELRIEVTANGISGYEAFHYFFLSPSPDYTLHISQWSGNIGNNAHGLRDHDNMTFSSFDRDTDHFIGNCAERWQGGWWYTDCLYVDLNSDSSPDSIRGPFHYVFTNNSFVGLSSTKMMFRVL